MPPAAVDPGASIRAYMDALRRRAWAQWGLRAVILGGACAGGVLVLSSAVTGPIATPLVATVAWCAVLAAAGFGLWRGAAPARALSGPRLTALLSSHNDALPSRVRSALELSAGETPQAEALRQAHLRSVQQSLRGVEPEKVLPWERMRTPQLGMALIGIVLSLVLLSAHPRLRAGARALWQPATAQDDGIMRAAIVAHLDARLVFPSYLSRSSETLRDPEEIRAPRGTTVELSVEGLIPANAGAVLIGDHEVRLREQAGRLVGRFVVRHDGALKLRLRDGERWYEDVEPRRVRALSDHTPEVVLGSPKTGSWVQADASQSVSFSATDDTGLTTIDVVVRLPGGTEHRRRVWSATRAGDSSTSLDETVHFLPAGLGVRPGDRFELWLEARDGDVVTGPNVGRSEIVVLEAASDARHLSQHIPQLRTLLDRSIEVLGDRLEKPVPKEPASATRRFAQLKTRTRASLNLLQRLVTALERATDPNLDVDALRGVHRRQDRLLRREGGLYRSAGRHAARVRHDGRTIEELERDTLLLEDMLAEAHLDEAGALAEELQRLQQRITELLQELGKSDSEEAHNALAAEIARAESRLRELMRSLSQMARQVPSEFVNQEALDSDREPSAADNLRELRNAISDGDLDEAAQRLQALQDQLTRLAESLQEGGLRFRQARHGERDRALTDAQEQLSMLADEQGRLAERSGQRLRDAMRRAAPHGQRGQEELKREAERLSEALDGLGEGDRNTGRRQMLNKARQRVQDTRDALQTGDLSEARRMAAAAERALDQSAGSLEMAAGMFQGHDGFAGQRAKEARDVADRAAALERGIGRRMPELSEHMSPQDRSQMRGDSRVQGQLRGKAQSLQEAVDRGPEGLPLSPDAARALQEATEHMRQAERQLRNGDGQAAGAAQEQATEKLQQVAEQLRRKRGDGEGEGEQKPGRQDGQGQDGGDGAVASRAPVLIPGSEDFDAPTAMRRQLLDAMREARPAGFERSVERYYRELLR